ncbi:MAG: biotin transporter BioY, partial [Mesorhizobium sp.]
FKLFGAMLAAEVVMMAMGFAWLAALIGPEKSWQFGVVPFIAGDLIKVALAASLVPAVWALLPKRS